MHDTIYTILKDTISTINVANDKLWGISYDALASTLIAMLVFVLGLFAKSIYVTKNNLKRLKSISHYFKSNISNILISASNELDSLKDIINQLSDNHDKNIYFKDNSSVSFDFYNKISHVDLFEIFLNHSISKNNNANIDKFISISNDICSLDYLIKHSKNIFVDYNKYISDYNKNCISSIKEIAYLINEYKKENIINKDNHNLDLFLNEIIELAINYGKQEMPKDSYVQQEHFIDPLINICNRYKQEVRAPDLIKYAMEFKFNFENRERTKLLMINIFKHNTELIGEIIINLKSLNLE